jgi:hypothetical protein
MKYEGTISVWIQSRNFGFIVDEQFQRFFFHRSRITLGIPVIGAHVLYDINPVREGTSLAAINVEILDIPAVKAVR